MLPAHKKLLLSQAIGSIVCNIPLNAALAWFTFPPVATLPIWARSNCVGFDTIGTSFFLPFITCLVLTPITRRLLRKRTFAAIPRAELNGFVRFWPNNFVGRGALVGFLCAISVGIITPTLLVQMGILAMTKVDVTVYKAVYTAILGVIVTPLFGLRALSDEKG